MPIRPEQAFTYSDTACRLGEGPLWHPEREQLFWFDILSHRLLTREGMGERERFWQFDEYVSAAGWIDRDSLLIASASALLRFDLDSGSSEKVISLDAENPLTRSNDGRVDPWGGFWISTMEIEPRDRDASVAGDKTIRAEHASVGGASAAGDANAGAIWRYYRGELRKLFGGIAIGNSICFSADGGFAFYADSADKRIMRQRLSEPHGWPSGEPECFIDLRGESFAPDGSVIDSQGHLWNARWGAGTVAKHSESGELLEEWSVPTPQASCPAFGGESLSILFVTSASVEVDSSPAGQTFAFETDAVGQEEHRVVL